MKAVTLTLALALAAVLMVIESVGVSALAWDGSDPYQTGCAPSSFVPHSAYDGTGWKIDLRFSNGCATAYARAVCHAPAWTWGCDGGVYLDVVRVNDGLRYYAGVLFAGNGTSTYTAQVDDAGSLQSAACLSNTTYPGDGPLPPDAPLGYWRVCTSRY